MSANSAADYETFGIQGPGVGDVGVAGLVLGRTAWVYAKKDTGTAAAEANLVDNGIDNPITLTTTAAIYSVTSTSSVYPSNVGMKSLDMGPATYLYECGQIIAFR